MPADPMHVIPVNDLIEHATDVGCEDCVCGPDWELVPDCENDTWIVVHHSLDGRELNEEPDAG